MIQQIIAYGIIVMAFGYAVFRIIKMFRKKKDPCYGCGFDCDSCALAGLKKDLEKRKRNKK